MVKSFGITNTRNQTKGELSLMYDFSVWTLLLGNAGLVIGVYLSELLLLPRFTFTFKRTVFDISLGFWVAVAIFKGWRIL